MGKTLHTPPTLIVPTPKEEAMITAIGHVAFRVTDLCIELMQIMPGSLHDLADARWSAAPATSP